MGRRSGHPWSHAGRPSEEGGEGREKGQETDASVISLATWESPARDPAVRAGAGGSERRAVATSGAGGAEGAGGEDEGEAYLACRTLVSASWAVLLACCT